MRKLLSLLLLLPLLAHAGTVTGTIQTASSGTVNNGTLNFSLNQVAVVSGTAQVVTTAVPCYTSNAGQIVGEPDPQTVPTLSTNTSSGTLASGTYFVKLSYWDASGESLLGPEGTVVLSATGTVIVTAPVVQPANASGYKVYIGATSGAETLQQTVTGFGNYSQTAALSAGAPPPGANSTACKIRFQDEMIPTTTYYSITLLNSGGNKVAGYPISAARFYGGSNGTVNVSNGWPVSIGGVVYPQPIVSTPNQNAVQSIAGPLNLGSFGITAGAGTFSGNVTAKTLNNICIADQQTGADLGAKINACVANGKEIWITQAGTISTQVVIQNLTSIYIRCLSWAGGAFGTLITDGITGNPAQPPILIKSTGGVGGFIRIEGCNLVGGATTGNLVSIIGSGSNPAFIELDHNTFGSTTGNGLDSTGASMSAAGIYAQGSLDLNIHDNDVAANVQGIVLDTGVNVAHIARNSINNNTLRAINTIKAQHIDIGPNNDIEGNATNTGDNYLFLQGCLSMCTLRDNWIEGNNGDILFQTGSGAVSGQVQVYGNILSHNVTAPNPSPNQVIDTEGTGTFSIHDNYFTVNLNIARFIDFNPTSNASATKDIRNNIFELSNGVSVSQAALFWQAGTNKSPIVIEGNNFGSISSAVFNGASAIEISAGTTSARVANNSCFTNSGTLTNCVKIDAGATGVIVQGTTASGTGTITNTVNDAGTNTVCLGAGCAAAITTGQIKVGGGTTLTGTVGTGTSIATNTAVQTFLFACTGTAAASNTIVLNHPSIVPACTNTTSVRPLGLISTGGNLVNLRVQCNTGGVNASSGAFTVFDNGSSTVLTCTMGTGTTCSDTTHTVAVSAAHELQIKFTTQAAETLANCEVAFEKQ